MADTADDGRAIGTLAFGKREIQLYQPSDGQMFIVLQVVDLADETELTEQVELVLNFATVIRKLFVNAADRQFVHRGLAADAFELEDYMDLARQIITEWAPEQAGNREERRHPAKKAAPAKRAARVRPAR